MKISLLTLGCKANQAEIAEMERSLRGQGHDIVDLADSPELCIVNTCTVTSKSDYQSRQLVRRAARVGAQVIVTGCYAELHADELKKIGGVTEVVPIGKKSDIIGSIKAESIPSTSSSYSLGGHSRHFLKIQDGCNRFCSYCIIPYVRGKPRSIGPERVISQINQAVSSGFREVVLTGIHLGLYGLDIGLTFSELLENIINKTKIERIRLSSLEINEIDERLLELFGSGRVCMHLHVPLQSGDDGILTAMKRGYRAGHFVEKLNKISEYLGDIALGTDVIVGFPGEGGQAFENTLNVLNSLPFTYIHAFPYSARPGTAAAGLSDSVPSNEKKRRVSVLRRLSERKKAAYMTAQIGRTLDTLIEETYPDGSCLGTSSNYLKVRATGIDCPRGSIVSVRALGLQDGRLLAERINFA